MLQRILGQSSILEKSLDAFWKRNEVISNNIANADTPGYKRSELRFEDTIRSAIDDTAIHGKKTQEKHMDVGHPAISAVEPRVIQDNKTTMRLDGNNVDIDREMADLAKNIIQYNALVQKVSKDLGRIKIAINEGRR